MAQIHCNFFSYSLCHGVDIEVTLPSFTSCNMDDPHTHSLPGKFPVVYLLHGMGNDYMAGSAIQALRDMQKKKGLLSLHSLSETRRI